MQKRTIHVKKEDGKNTMEHTNQNNNIKNWNAYALRDQLSHELHLS